MTDTPDWVLKEAAKRCDWHPSKTLAQMRGYLSSSASFTELCRAIEQHEAFRQEVSDAVEAYLNPDNRIYSHTLNRFIIPKPKPDPLVDVLRSVGGDDRDYCDYDIYVKEIRAALEARGFEIREKDDD
jgi:hypothetical protein